ncbi:MAG: hypothetical protein ACAH17_00140 [Candidatus Paceibacterota bacterium]
MIKDLSELQNFILWAKSQKLKSVRVGECQFEFSDQALNSDLPDVTEPEAKKDLSVPPSSPKLPGGNAQLSEEEELLFWSTR